MKFRFHPDALHEYEGSTRYYRAINPQLAQSFVHEIEKSIKHIQLNPVAWIMVEDDVRRCLVQRFPFGIYFTIESDHFLIVAVMHLSRQPGYWKERMEM